MGVERRGYLSAIGQEYRFRFLGCAKDPFIEEHFECRERLELAAQEISEAMSKMGVSALEAARQFEILETLLRDFNEL